MEISESMLKVKVLVVYRHDRHDFSYIQTVFVDEYFFIYELNASNLLDSFFSLLTARYCSAKFNILFCWIKSIQSYVCM